MFVGGSVNLLLAKEITASVNICCYGIAIAPPNYPPPKSPKSGDVVFGEKQWRIGDVPHVYILSKYIFCSFY